MDLDELVNFIEKPGGAGGAKKGAKQKKKDKKQT
jgi:hypothetical protein